MPKSTANPTSPKNTGTKMTIIWTAVAPRSEPILTPDSWLLTPSLFRYFMSTRSYVFGLFAVLRFSLLRFLLGLLLFYSGQVGLDGCRQSRVLSWRERLDQTRGYYHQKLVRGLLARVAAEQLSQNRNIAQAFHLVHDVGDAIVDQTGDGEALAIFEDNFRFRYARRNRRNQESLQGNGVGEIQRADFGFHFQVDRAGGSCRGREIKLHAEFLELHGDHRSDSGAAGRGRDSRER